MNGELEVDKKIKEQNNIGQIFCNYDRNNADVSKSDNNLWSNIGFQRDLSRIIFSNAYRRLAGKTQIFPIDENDHYMTRLTHTLVVNNIALDIANNLNNELCANINIDLIQAIANGHDVGHTPFGHAGERTINSYCEQMTSFSEKYFFKHNLFGVDILQNLERVKNNEYGYDLSWQVIDGIIKHTDVVKNDLLNRVLDYQINNKFLKSNNLNKAINSMKYCINYQKSINYFEYPFPITIEGQIVKIADEIAQYYHDILDFSRFYMRDKEKSPIYSLLNSDLCSINDLREQPQFISKFINTYYSEGEIKNNKIFRPENRETFANDFKELFINEVIHVIKKKIKENNNICINVEPNTQRFIVENILFDINKDNKVIPLFDHDYIKKASEIFINYRKQRICDNEIKKFDGMGKKNIDKTLMKIIKNKKICCNLCGNDFVREISILCRKNYIEIKKADDNKVINFDLLTTTEVDEIVQYLYSCIFKKNVKGLYKITYSDEQSEKYFKDAFYGSIVSSVARMTDFYISSQKYKN